MNEQQNPVLAEVWRGDVLECIHRGTAVVSRANGEIVAAWGDPSRRILPRSACKMVQALAMVESGAADEAGLGQRHLALACASHKGAAVHTDLADAWLREIGLAEDALRCGPQLPSDERARLSLECAGRAPGQIHNNCSGKHVGMLTLNRHMAGGPEYLDPDHPVQRAIRAATSETAGEEITDWAIDGCSAPNWVVSLAGLARAAAGYADPSDWGGRRAESATRLRDAMMAEPVLVAGEGRSCTRLMRAAGGRAAVKTGAEGVFVGILPEAELGIALKIDDGATRAAEAAITALLVRFGAIDRNDPVFRAYADAPILNRRNIECGRIRAAAVLAD